jgi:hypothetical protein
MKRKEKIECIRSSTMERTKKKLSIRSSAIEQTKTNECIRSSTMKRTKKNEGICSSTIDVLPLLVQDKCKVAPYYGCTRIHGIHKINRYTICEKSQTCRTETVCSTLCLLLLQNTCYLFNNLCLSSN